MLKDIWLKKKLLDLRPSLFITCLLVVTQFVCYSQNSSETFLAVDTTEVLLEEVVTIEFPHDEFDSSHNEVLNDSGIVAFDSVVQGRLDTTRASELVKAVLRDSLYWISIDTNFAIFDSMSVNPYKFKGETFRDSVVIALYSDDLSPDARLWSMPLKQGIINSQFGLRHHKWHYGTDLDLVIGDSVFACFDGVVRISKYNPGGYGNYVLIRHHNGLETLYGHLTKQLVKVGQQVKAGDLIGWGGNTGRSTGPHLHFEVRYHGEAINPEGIYDFPNNTLKSASISITPANFKYIKDLRAARYHRIRSGDTLSGLAVKYHTSIRTICKLNGISTKTVLRVGKTIRVR